MKAYAGRRYLVGPSAVADREVYTMLGRGPVKRSPRYCPREGAHTKAWQTAEGLEGGLW